MPDNSYMLSPKGGRKCLANEIKAEKFDEAVKADGMATASANSKEGELAESRKQGSECAKKNEELVKDNTLKDVELKEVKRKSRWKQGVVGVVAFLGGILITVKIMR